MIRIKPIQLYSEELQEAQTYQTMYAQEMDSGVTRLVPGSILSASVCAAWNSCQGTSQALVLGEQQCFLP